MMASDDCIPGYDPQRFQFVRLCDCGCQQPTRVMFQSVTRLGKVNGHIYSTLAGHHSRLRDTTSYPQVQYQKGKTSLVHRRRAEAARGGKPLPRTAVVHHPDEDPWNPNARLVICPSQKYHFLLHIRARVLAAGGNPNTDKICQHCRVVKPQTEFYKNRRNCDGLADSCSVCVRERVAEYHQRIKAQQQR